MFHNELTPESRQLPKRLRLQVFVVTLRRIRQGASLMLVPHFVSSWVQKKGPAWTFHVFVLTVRVSGCNTP